MKEKRLELIKCPNCGAEYLPAEIYLPNSFLGKPSCIEKDHMTGEIKDFFGRSMDLRERYNCDRCGTTFNVDCSVKFYTRIVEEESFNKDYTTKYKVASLFLNE